ncbi:MAG TPA: GNAT family N-acetyltransferase [Actinocrinis sp.]|nr:GNAT family N-acetyltransferase [Actinocrinis sp.]
MSEPSPAATVERVDAERLYQIVIDGGRAGLVAYRDRDNQRVFYHTEVDDAFAGQGLASRLVQQALTDTRSAGKRIVPVCPYVAAFLKRHEEFADVTDAVTPEIGKWLESELS